MASHIEQETFIGHVRGSKTTSLRIRIHKSPASETLDVNFTSSDTYQLIETLGSAQTCGACRLVGPFCIQAHTSIKQCDKKVDLSVLPSTSTRP